MCGCMWVGGFVYIGVFVYMGVFVCAITTNHTHSLSHIPHMIPHVIPCDVDLCQQACTVCALQGLVLALTGQHE